MVDRELRKKIQNADGFRDGLAEVRRRIDAMTDDDCVQPNPHEAAMREALADIKGWNPGHAKAIEDFIVEQRRWFLEFANLLIDSDYFQCELRDIEPRERAVKAAKVAKANDPKAQAMLEIREAWKLAHRPGASFAKEMALKYQTAGIDLSEGGIKNAISRWRRESSS